MKLFIGYTSALHFWLRGSNGLWQVDPCRISSLSECAYNSTDVASFQFPRSAFGPGPLHLMVDASGKRRIESAQVCHVWRSQLVPNSFTPIGGNVFVASPALCFLQAAQTLSLFDLAELGYELCGFYSRTPGVGKGFTERYTQLTTPKQITLLCDKLSRVSGSRKAQRAIKRVLPDSKSPAETDLAIKMVFPLVQGGYGLPLAELNSKIPLSEEALAIVGYPNVYPDLLWRKKKVCLEYDSNQHHSGDADRKRDSRKRNALGCMGYKVITVTSSQLQSVVESDGIAAEASRYLGVRIRPTSPKTLQARFELNEAIKKRMRDDQRPNSWPYI